MLSRNEMLLIGFGLLVGLLLMGTMMESSDMSAYKGHDVIKGQWPGWNRE